MGVHAGEGEEDAVDVGLVAGLEEGAPGGGDGCSGEGAGDGGEVEVGEDDVEAGEPGRALPLAVGRVEVDLLGDHEVEAVEPFEAVGGGQEVVDGLHEGEDFGDGGWGWGGD